MEKFGVACKCAEGEVNTEGMEKLASGDYKCPQCGVTHKLDKISLKEQVKLEDRMKK